MVCGSGKPCGIWSCFECYKRTLKPILHELVEYLGYETLQSGLKAVWDTFNECLQESYGGWKNILKKAINGSVDLALSALRVAREEIVKVCQENHKILEQLAKLTTKTCLSNILTKQALKVTTKIGAREGTKQAVKLAASQGAVKGGAKFVVKSTETLIVSQAAKTGIKQTAKRGSKLVVKQTSKSIVKTATKEGTKQTIKQGSKAAASQATKSVIKSVATPLSIGADLAQAGLEWAGYKEVGKTIGITGNIAAGAAAGSVAGPPGVALGALGGFLVWGAGEVVGGLVDRAFGDGPTNSAAKNTDSTSNKPKLKDVFRMLLPLATDWFNIGVLLGIEEDILEEIQQNERQERNCLRVMLSKWLKSEDPPPTWHDLAEAVEPLNEKTAEEIRRYTAG